MNHKDNNKNNNKNNNNNKLKIKERNVFIYYMSMLRCMRKMGNVMLCWRMRRMQGGLIVV